VKMSVTGGAGAEALSAEEKKMRAARRGSSMLTALTKATVASIRMQNLADRANKTLDEKRRRAEFAMIAATSEKWIWIADEAEGYIPAKILNEKADGSMEVELGVSRTLKTCKKAELGPPIVRMAEMKHHVDGMAIPLEHSRRWCASFGYVENCRHGAHGRCERSNDPTQFENAICRRSDLHQHR
jgi:hypothetical protein